MRLASWEIARELLARYATRRQKIFILALAGSTGVAIWAVGWLAGTSAAIAAATFAVLAGLPMLLVPAISWLGWRVRQVEARAILADEIGESGLWHGTTLYSAQPDFMLAAVRLVRDRRPGTVVELGAGVSTIVLASALRRNGTGRLISIENDASYAESIRQRLKSLQLENVVTLVVTELTSFDS